MSIQHLIFDIDGTLWDSRALVAKGYNAHLREAGHPELQVDVAFLTTVFGKTMDEIADIMMPTIPAPQRKELLMGCMRREHEALEQDPCHIAFPGVVETLEGLSKDYRLYIVSNSQCGYPELLMNKLNVAHLFRDHLCFGDTGTPKGQTIRLLMERNGIDSAVYIGDTQGDLEACRDAGLPFIYCAYGFGSPEHWDAKIDSFDQLPHVLENWG